MPKKIPGLHALISSVYAELDCLSFSGFILFHSKTRNKSKLCAFSPGPQENLSTPVWHPDFSQLPDSQWDLYPFATDILRSFWREGTTSSPSHLIFPKGK